MLAADKLLLQASVKQSAISLREKELQLFSNNFSAIGTQAALLAGFALTALAEFQVPPNSPLVFKSIFYVLAICTFASALVCVCNTTFVSVWGPGLALRGPDGSMVDAINGMIEERKLVFLSFGMAVMSFLTTAISMSWLVMPFGVAAVCSCILIYVINLIQVYGKRIYKRFEVRTTTRFDDILDGAGRV